MATWRPSRGTPPRRCTRPCGTASRPSSMLRSIPTRCSASAEMPCKNAARVCQSNGEYTHHLGGRYETDHMDEAHEVPGSIPAAGAAHGVGRDADRGTVWRGEGAAHHLCLRRVRRDQPLLGYQSPK